jgi:hypothetical protein
MSKKIIKNVNKLIKIDIELNKNNMTKSNSKLNFENCYYCINYSCTFLYKTIKFFIKISGVYILWIILHFCASYLYTKLCVPTTFIGLLMSPFLTTTPHCQGLRWVIYNGANIINNMWLVIVTWICANIMGINNTQHEI